MSATIDLLNKVLDKIAEVANEGYALFGEWVSDLTDVEKVFFMVVFILLLFMLILSRAGRRKSEPARGRSFLSSIVLVVLFSFGAGWMIDARYDMQAVFNFV